MAKRSDKVVHFEIPVDDLERARRFYGSIFNWDLQDWPMPDGSLYIGCRTVPVNQKTRLPTEAGAINGGIMKRSATVKAPVLAMNVDSVDRCIAKIAAAGGRVVTPKVDMMGMGFYAYVTDLDGNVIGLWEDAKKPKSKAKPKKKPFAKAAKSASKKKPMKKKAVKKSRR